MAVNFVTTVFFIVGTAVGSFLNVLIDRIPKGKSVSRGRSKCDKCYKTLSAIDLIPVVSYLLLRGKCRHCNSSISAYYPVVELATGFLFSFTAWWLIGKDSFLELVFSLFILSALTVIFFADLKYRIVPDKILYPAIVFSLLYLMLTGIGGAPAFDSSTKSSIINNLSSGTLSFLFFFLLHSITRGRGMGFGDVKLSFLIGLFLGFPKIVFALYTAFLTGAMVSAILVVAGKKKIIGDTIPFAPFLVTGTVISYFYGDKILRLIGF